jgi:hypothetical protein
MTTQPEPTRSDAPAAFKRTEPQRSPSPARSDGTLSVLFAEPQRRFESRLREVKIEMRSSQ